MLWTGKHPRRTSSYAQVQNTIRFRATISRTDLHGILDIFKRTVDSYLEFVACFFGESLESRPREPVWDVPYYQRARQVLVGYFFDV